MIFWRIKLLKQPLIEEELSQKHLSIYIVIFIIFCETGFENTNIDDYFDFMISIGIIVIGMLLLYKANGGSAGKQFADMRRYIGELSSMSKMSPTTRQLD